MFNLSILAIDKVVFKGDVDSVNVPGANGELTILKNHIPLLTYLAKGDVKVKNGEREERFPIFGGILEVSPDETNILAIIREERSRQPQK